MGVCLPSLSWLYLPFSFSLSIFLSAPTSSQENWPSAVSNPKTVEASDLSKIKTWFSFSFRAVRGLSQNCQARHVYTYASRYNPKCQVVYKVSAQINLDLKPFNCLFSAQPVLHLDPFPALLACPICLPRHSNLRKCIREIGKERRRASCNRSGWPPTNFFEQSTVLLFLFFLSLARSLSPNHPSNQRNEPTKKKS